MLGHYEEASAINYTLEFDSSAGSPVCLQAWTYAQTLRIKAERHLSWVGF